MNRFLALLLMIVICIFAVPASAADVKTPEGAVAGKDAILTTSGSGPATLYLFGPGQPLKRSITLGQEIVLKGDQLRNAGLYTIILAGGDGPVSKPMYIAPGPPAKINFLARPSRVPVAQPNAITGTAFVFDDFHNLVLTPTPVRFDLSVKDGGTVSRMATSKYGVAFVDLGSSSREGAAQFVVSAGQGNVRRVVQQVASEPCKLNIHLRREENWLVAETDPLRDCSGNSIPDGTIVTFTERSTNGLSTVDARTKKGIARAQLPIERKAIVSAAAGIRQSDDVRVGGGE